MNLKSLKFIVMFLTLSSCGAYLNNNVNPYHFGMTVFDSNKLKKTKDVKIYNYTEENLNYFLKQGYKVKAKSAFREKYVNMDWAKLASKQLGTPIMLLKDEYVGSVSGRRTLTFTIPGEKYVVTSKTNANLDYNSNTNAYAIGTNGYAVGSSSTYGNANYNSTTKTTIQGPDRYGYTSVPYKDNYYDYYAVFLVKPSEGNTKKTSHYFVEYEVSSYSDKDLNFSNGDIFGSGAIQPNEKFELIEKGKNYYKIKHKGEIKYIGNRVPLKQ